MTGQPFPQLTTARLTLRAHETADFDDLLSLWSDPDVVRYIGGRANTADEVWSRLLRYRGLWPLLGFGYWRIEDRQTGRYVGDAGLADFRRGLGDGFDESPETGWALAPWAHGQGLAGEAMGAILKWADETAEIERTVCMIQPENAASLRLAGRLGYRPMGQRSFNGSPTQTFERQRYATSAAP